MLIGELKDLWKVHIEESFDFQKMWITQKLRSSKLVEGRITNLYLSASAAKSMDDSASYIKNKGFNDKYYKDLIVEYLKQYERAKKRDIRELLWDKLPDSLSDAQKEHKIRNLLTSLRVGKIIDTDSKNQQQSNWILKKWACLNYEGFKQGLAKV